MLLSLIAVPSVMAKKPSGITWSRTYVPIVGYDSVQVTSDGGFVASGRTRSNGAWVMEASPTGDPEWERGYLPLGYADAEALSIQQTRDRGYIVAGDALSLGYVTSSDAWLLRLDHQGNVQWSRTYGGRAGEGFTSVQQTNDGGYVAAGLTESFGPGVQFSGETAWVVRVDLKGNVVWQKDFGADEAQSVQQTSDGGFIVAGTAAVGNFPNADAWIFKLDPNANMVWQKTFEVTIDNRGYSVQQTNDGGYVLVAEVITLSPIETFLSSNALIIRLDGKGDVLWQKSFNGGQFTHPFSVRETSDHGFIVAGRSSGPFLLKLDANGDIVWQKLYGRPNDFFYQVQETIDGGLIVVGEFFVTGSAWVLRLDGEGSIQGCPIGLAPNATITNAAAVMTNRIVIDVDTNAFVTVTGVSVNTGNSNSVATISRHVEERVRNPSSPFPFESVRI